MPVVLVVQVVLVVLVVLVVPVVLVVLVVLLVVLVLLVLLVVLVLLALLVPVSKQHIRGVETGWQEDPQMLKDPRSQETRIAFGLHEQILQIYFQSESDLLDDKLHLCSILRPDEPS